MNKIMNSFRQVRASNIIFLFMVPVIIYFLATSRNYLPALKSVLGVEENATELLISFLIISFLSLLTFTGSLFLLKSVRIDQKPEIIKKMRRLSSIFLATALALSLIFHFTSILNTYAISVTANSMDPRNTEWIIIVNQSFTLDPDFEMLLLSRVALITKLVTLISLVIFSFSLVHTKYHNSALGRSLILLFMIYGFLLAFYFIMVAHAGFAVGLMITLRAAFFAYLGASILGLIWALLTKLSPSKSTTQLHFVIGIGLLILGTVFLLQKHKEVALVGSLDGKIGIISGTPQWVTDSVRYGDFLENPPQKPFKIRSLKNITQALSLLEKGKISGLIVPIEKIGTFPLIWKTNFLPTKQKNIGLGSIFIGFLIILLTTIGIISNLHPLAVFSDFFVDTIRGIPMIVIILYIGLPLAGAIKSASGGYMNIEMMTRGIIAIAIGYSAYMAEIFRAGIEAIPKGQIEAARTLGMREHHVARFVIIPQAVAIVLPALGNEFIAMLKDTSLLSILSIRDVTQRMKEFQAQSFLAFEPFNTAALLYVFLTLLAASGIKSLDKIVNKNRLSEK